MKSLRTCLIGFVLLLVLASALLWFLPARWALPWIEPSLHGIRLQQVSGSVWNGHAGAVVTADGRTRGQLQWQLSRRALLGQPRLRLDFDGPQLHLSGGLERLPGDEVEVRDANVRASSTAIGQELATPWGKPRGELQLEVPHARLRAGWPMQMDAQASWHDAVMRTPQGDVALGELQATARARGGVIDVQLRDSGSGPLQLAGELQLSPLGWRLDATLHARQTDPMLRRWLSTLAPPAADGSTHIRRHGGLAANASPAPTH